MKETQKYKWLTLSTIAISAIVHLVTYYGLDFIKIAKPKVVPETIEISVIEQTKQKPTLKPKAVKKQKIKNVQVVEQNDKSLNNEVPDKQYFLSKNNQRVKEQTKVKHHGDFKNNAGKGQSGKAKKNKARKKKIAHKRKTKSIDGIKVKNLLPQHSYSSAKNFEANEAQSGQRSQSNDYLKNVKEGQQTILNTREFIYYAYYERIRGKIRKYWEPVIKDKVKHVFETGRKLASIDHKTAVIITLDGTGALVNVQVKDGSGVRDLDEAAIEAFKKAEPFPNPPDGIIENDGKIRINWNFVLEA